MVCNNASKTTKCKEIKKEWTSTKKRKAMEIY